MLHMKSATHSVIYFLYSSMVKPLSSGPFSVMGRKAKTFSQNVGLISVTVIK